MGGKTCNIAILNVLQQCCKTSCTFPLPVLPYLKKKKLPAHIPSRRASSPGSGAHWRNDHTQPASTCLFIIYLSAWVSSLAVSTYYLFFPLGAILSERFGCWVVALLGTLACSIGLLSSSFVTSLPMLYLTYSVVWGMGASFVYFADLLILTKYFKARLAFANGIMALGGAVGGSILNPTMQQMFIHLGLANMFRVLSGAFLILSAFSLVYRPKRRVFPRNGDAMDSECEKKCTFDWEILKNKAFIMWIAVIFIFMLGYMVPFVHLVSILVIIIINNK